MLGLARRMGLVLLLLVTFVALQTGWARAVEDPCIDDETSACVEASEPLSCAPSCADCHGCAGPARALLARATGVPAPASHRLAVDEPTRTAVPRDHHQRIDRPPRV